MSALDGPVYAAAVLLVISGISKVRDPAPTIGAVRSVGWSAPRSIVRLGGAAECVLGTLTLLIGGVVLNVLVAGAYAGFTVFIVYALARGGAIATCGCFGREDTPATRTHTVLTALLALSAAGAAAIGGTTGLLNGARTTTGLVVLLVALLTTWLTRLVFVDLPKVGTTPT